MGQKDYDKEFPNFLDLEFRVTAENNKKDSNFSTASKRKFNQAKKKEDRTKAGKMKKSNFIDSDSNEETKSNNKRQQGIGRDKY